MQRRVAYVCGLWSLMLMLWSVVASALPPAATFTVSGSRILKNGSEFIIHGINVNGPGWRSSRKTVDDIDSIVGLWHFNLIRVNCGLKPRSNDKEPNDLDAIVQAFTSRGVVVLIDPHDHVGSYYENPPEPSDLPSLNDLRHWQKDVATRYKNNPYVWFETMSGPGKQEEKSASPYWKVLQAEVLRVIREDAGAQNIVVCDGQERGTEDGNNGALPVPEDRSAILAYGPELAKQYPNLVFAFNVYHGWDAGGVEKLGDYVERVQAKHLPLFVAEYGMVVNEDFSMATEAMFTVCKQRHMGRCAWHWIPQDRNVFCTTDNKNGGWEIDKRDGSKPTNLSWFGDRVWDDNHDIVPFHGPALDRSTWTATAFTASKEDGGHFNQPDEVFDTYHNQDEDWISGMQQAPGQWFQIDMGAKQKFSRMLIDTRTRTGDFMRGYEIYVSNDGTTWGTPIAQGKNEQTSLRLTFAPQYARYIKIVLTEKSWHYWRIADVQVYAPVGAVLTSSGARPPLNEIVLDTRGWSAYAEPVSWAAPRFAVLPLESEEQHWTTDRRCEPGQFYQVDMGETRRFHKIVMNVGRYADHYPRGYEVYVSENGTDWGKPIASGRGAPITTVTFPTQTARYIRVIETRYSRWTPWSMAEFRLYGIPAGAVPVVAAPHP